LALLTLSLNQTINRGMQGAILIQKRGYLAVRLKKGST
jgi:hypothetical protein